jgi:hypothetical protein
MDKHEELLEAVKELCEYLELEDGEWPHIHVWNAIYGSHIWGSVSDDLATKLYRLHMFVKKAESEVD